MEIIGCKRQNNSQKILCKNCKCNNKKCEKFINRFNRIYIIGDK